MSHDHRESDWKVIKELHHLAMERFFQRAVAGLARKSGNERETNRARFWEVHEQVTADAREAAEMFDGLRRSVAKFKLMRWRREGLVRGEELNRLSEELQASVRAVAES